MKTFVIGDIHGSYKGLIQCLERSSFNYEKDKLICLGDVADGWSQVPECFDELLKIKNLVYIIGNHDEWLKLWFNSQRALPIWVMQGGRATLKCYKNLMNPGDEKRHLDFLNNGVFYHIEGNRLFVHGGYNWKKSVKETSNYELTWDRHLYNTARYWETLKDKPRVKEYEEVFIGHTSTCYSQDPDSKKYVLNDMKPMHVSNIWNLDQGAGWEGKLTIMNVDTKEYWQSDCSSDLYPNEKGR